MRLTAIKKIASTMLLLLISTASLAADLAYLSDDVFIDVDSIRNNGGIVTYGIKFISPVFSDQYTILEQRLDCRSYKEKTVSTLVHLADGTVGFAPKSTLKSSHIKHKAGSRGMGIAKVICSENPTKEQLEQQ